MSLKVISLDDFRFLEIKHIFQKFLSKWTNKSLESCLEPRNWVFDANSNFRILISVQPNGLNLQNFKLRISTNRIHSLKYLRFTRLDCKDIRIRKSEFVAKLNSFNDFTGFELSVQNIEIEAMFLPNLRIDFLYILENVCYIACFKHVHRQSERNTNQLTLKILPQDKYFYYKECLFWLVWGNSSNKEVFRHSTYIIHYTVFRMITNF